MTKLTKATLGITLESTDGKKVCLADFTGKNIVLYFYPKDNTPGCTQEGMDFRDLHAEFERCNAVIIGVSKDTIQCHLGFQEKYQLPFILLADTEEALCQAFEVIKEKSMYGKTYLGIERSTFLINTQGELIQEWRKVKVPDHVQQVLTALKDMA